jgi:hypothetical protein
MTDEEREIAQQIVTELSDISYELTRVRELLEAQSMVPRLVEVTNGTSSNRATI